MRWVFRKSLAYVRGWRLSPSFPSAGEENIRIFAVVVNAGSSPRTCDSSRIVTGKICNLRNRCGRSRALSRRCSHSVRNAVSDALTAVYGKHWPWDKNFENSLPVSKGHGYQQRQDLINARTRFRTTDRIVVELKFVFWEKMFTSRHDQRIWNTHLFSLFPNLDPAKTVSAHRMRLATDLETIRLLRNRIAHHEPIFRRNLADELSKMHSLIEARCQISAAWMMKEQLALTAIQAKPF